MIKTGILNRAYEVALKSETYPFKVSAVIFKGKRIYSEGVNAVRSNKATHPKFKRFAEALHAEAASLANFIPGELKGCSIFICRINAGSKKTSNGKPCARCQALLYAHGIKTVYCTNDSGGIDKYTIKPSLFQEKISFDESKGHDYRNMFIEPAWVSIA